MTHRICVGVLVLFTLACGGPFIDDGPKDVAEAFRWAEVSYPAGASNIRYEGHNWLDFYVTIQFELANESEVNATVPCRLEPWLNDEPVPFSFHGPDWVEEAPAGATFCKVRTSTGVSQRFRVDPLPSGFRVQMFAFST